MEKEVISQSFYFFLKNNIQRRPRRFVHLLCTSSGYIEICGTGKFSVMKTVSEDTVTAEIKINNKQKDNRQ